MSYAPPELLKLLHDTRAVSIWNRDRGPVFWYAAHVPGPFYVNTEKVIGAPLAEKMLREITAIVAGTVDVQARAEQLHHLIMDAYKTNQAWQKLIATMMERARGAWNAEGFSMISGGERRDWLFSIPFAHAAAMPHVFLFKNKTYYGDRGIKKGAAVLHVSDLINNAASFFDLWQPALHDLGLACAGNLCVTLRGAKGLQRLRDAGQNTASLVTIDQEFFRLLHADHLIDRATFEEIAVFFASPQDWASTYLMGKPALFAVSSCDEKSFERLRFFIAQDPWKLRPAHQDFFAAMQRAIDARVGKAG